jgi:methylthioribose-1-phosphate isomerase
MNIDGRHFRTIWPQEPECRFVRIINQQTLPFKFEIIDLHTAEDVAKAITEMYVRGAGLIGAAAAYGMYLAALHASEGSFDKDMAAAAEMLKNTRPTAANLAAAVDRMLAACNDGTCSASCNLSEKKEKARLAAQAIADEDAGFCKKIGLNGLEIIKAV